MSVSLRWRATLTKADAIDVEETFRKDTHGVYDQYVDRELSLIPSGTYTLSGFTYIKELCIATEEAVVEIVITKEGPESFVLPCDGILILQNTSLTGLELINPSSVNPMRLRLIAAGV